MKFDRFVRKNDLVALTQDLVRIPTENPPGLEKGAALFLKPLLKKMGFRVQTVLSPAGRYNLLAERRYGRGGRSLAFCGHLDVVPAGDDSLWTYPPYGGKLVKGRIYGRGASDMKGGIASFLHAVSALDRAGLAPERGALLLNLASDEESHGHHGVGFLAGRGLLKGDAVIVGEPTDLDFVIAEKGAFWFRVVIAGKPAHGSAPERGVNAIEQMMKAVEAIKGIPLGQEHPFLGRPTVNIGMIRGGAKINIVPDRCEIEIDRRVLPAEKTEEILGEVEKRLTPIQKKDPTFRFRLEKIDFAEPFEIDPAETIVRLGLEAAGEVLTRKPVVKGFPGFTDGRFYVNQFGIPALIFGPGDPATPHTTDESTEVEKLVLGSRIYGRMIRSFLAGEAG
jgi:succinyl-diaminopimelate desuccinylase